MPLLDLSLDELLTTTRTVRKRLDFSRPVEPEVIRECLSIALQAPSGSNRQHWQFVVVSDVKKRQAIGDFYRRSFDTYRASSGLGEKVAADQPERRKIQQRVMDSSTYLAEHMHEAPIHLIPCLRRSRLDGLASSDQAGPWASILPATWNFMLAARARGLGAALTTLHLDYEREVAEILNIPYHEVTQAALLPVAYTIGTDFKPAPREPLASVLHWDQW